MVNGEPDQDSIENAEESMSPRQRRFDWTRIVHKMAAKVLGAKVGAKVGAKHSGEADELSED